MYGIDTSYRRGWILTYEIKDEQLYLTKINTAVPFPDVEALSLPRIIPFLGEVWLARKIVMHPSPGVIGYQYLYHFTFWDGVVQSCQDLSPRNDEMRRLYLATQNPRYPIWLYEEIYQQPGWYRDNFSGEGILGSNIN